MNNLNKHYVAGEWLTPKAAETLVVTNPADNTELGEIVVGNLADVDRAVEVARIAFDSWSRSRISERVELMNAIIEVYNRRIDDIAQAISQEMGAPMARLAQTAHAPSGLKHFVTAANVLKEFPFEEIVNGQRVVHEPVGVCALITPWNWPVNQIACKVAPALAAGCTMVLKPSEIAPLSAHVLAEILDEAGVPKGVFNLIDGDGAVTGSALCAHRSIDMISFTGSTRAGKLIGETAARGIKRLALELGGKSPNLLLDDCDFEAGVKRGVDHMMRNTGQSCNAPSRMLVPRARLAEAETFAAQACASLCVGNPNNEATDIGPLSSEVQLSKVQGLIQVGIDEGAKLVCGGTGLPEGITAGCFTKPTVFSEVHNDMTIAREEIFGPVLCLLPYDNEEQAIAIANDTDYGLAAYVQSADAEKALAVARRLRAGNITINGAGPDFALPFGGFKQSGIGREWGKFGFEEFLEIKAIVV